MGYERLRQIQRTIEIGRVMAYAGGGILTAHSWMGRTLYGSDMGAPENMLREMFERLGPTFIKFGQILAQRPDLLPAPYIAELEHLEDAVPQFDPQQAIDVVTSELGPVDELFERFEREPMAAASIAQVHRARLHTGEEVIVKVRRPGIRRQMEEDLAILDRFARFADRHSRLIRRLQVYPAIREFERWTLQELDLAQEGENARRLQHNMEHENGVTVPNTYPQLTTERVLVMDYVEGVKVTDASALEAIPVSREELSRRMVHASMKQVMRDGFFHADPHPSNFLISPEGTITYLDFGMMGRLSRQHRRTLAMFVLHLKNEDAAASFATFQKLVDLPPGIDTDNLRQELERKMMQLNHASLEDQSPTKTLFDMLVLASENGADVPPDLIMMAKSMITIEGIGLTVSPEYPVTEEIEAAVEDLFLSFPDPETVASQFYADLMDHRDLITRGPTMLQNVLRPKRSQISIEYQHPEHHATTILAALLAISGMIMLIRPVIG